MPFGFGGKGAAIAGIAAELLSDLVCAPQRPVPRALALARVPEAVAVPAKKMATRS